MNRGINFNSSKSRLSVDTSSLEIFRTNSRFPYHYHIFCGLLLSYGWIYPHHLNNSIARFKVRLSSVNKEYAFSLYREISLFCDKYPYLYTKAGEPTDEILISTKWLHCFAQMYEKFYPNYNLISDGPSRRSVRRRKVVPDHIYDLLTPLALAYWVNSSGVKLKGRGLKLYIDKDFNALDTVKLINVLIIKYRLSCTIISEGSLAYTCPGSAGIMYKDKFVIYISRSSLDLLEKVIDLA